MSETTNTTTTKRRRRTPEQRARFAEYMRQYRKDHADKVRQWRMNYIRNAARRLEDAEDRADGDPE